MTTQVTPVELGAMDLEQVAAGKDRDGNYLPGYTPAPGWGEAFRAIDRATASTGGFFRQR